MNAIHKTIIGQSHIHQNKPSQDASFSRYDDHYGIIAVADGHGSSRYFRSDRGSIFAIQAIEKVFTFIAEKYTYNDIKNNLNMINHIKKTVLTYWSDFVDQDLKIHGISDEAWTNCVKASFAKEDLTIEELHTEISKLKANHATNPYKTYGTTCLAALMTDEYYILLKIGDGLLSTFNTDHQHHIFQVEDDEGPHGGTDSLCTFDAYDHMYIQVEKMDQDLGVFMCTDGVSEALSKNEYLFANIKNIINAYQTFSDHDMDEALHEWLFAISQNSLAKDDASLALLLSDLNQF